MEKILTAENFEEIVMGAEVPVLVDFWATWCGPCMMLAPIVEEIADEREDVLVGKINVDEEPELSEKFSVFSIPMLVVMKNGEILEQSVGARPKVQILDMLEG